MFLFSKGCGRSCRPTFTGEENHNGEQRKYDRSGKFEELVPLSTMAAIALVGKGVYSLFEMFPNWDHGRRFISPLCLSLGYDPSRNRFFTGTKGTSVVLDDEG